MSIQASKHELFKKNARWIKRTIIVRHRVTVVKHHSLATLQKRFLHPEAQWTPNASCGSVVAVATRTGRALPNLLQNTFPTGISRRGKFSHPAAFSMEFNYVYPAIDAGSLKLK